MVIEGAEGSVVGAAEGVVEAEGVGAAEGAEGSVVGAAEGVVEAEGVGAAEGDEHESTGSHFKSIICVPGVGTSCFIFKINIKVVN